MRQTTIPNFKSFSEQWVIIDLTDRILGRIASRISLLLQGKHLSNYMDHVPPKINVIAINAAKIKLSANKINTKKYYHHSQYPGGLKVTYARDKKPEFIVYHAVKLMLPGRRQLIKNFYVYHDQKHPHTAQKPLKIDITKKKGMIKYESEK